MPVGMPNGSIKKTFEYRGLKFRREPATEILEL